MNELCEFCDRQVPVERMCRFVVDGGHLEEICITICHDCLVRSNVAYCGEGWLRKRQAVIK